MNEKTSDQLSEEIVDEITNLVDEYDLGGEIFHVREESYEKQKEAAYDCNVKLSRFPGFYVADYMSYHRAGDVLFLLVISLYENKEEDRRTLFDVKLYALDSDWNIRVGSCLEGKKISKNFDGCKIDEEMKKEMIRELEYRFSTFSDAISKITLMRVA